MSRGGGGAAAGSSPGTGSDIAALTRPEFPILSRIRYLDTATRGPLARGVRAAIEQFLAARAERHDEKSAWRPTVEAVRANFARLIGAAPGEIALMRNTSDALNAVAHSIPWRRGDNVVLSAAEHPNNLFPWLHLRRRYGVEVRLAPADGGTLEPVRLAALMDSRTRVVAVSMVGFMPGTRARLGELSTLCRASGAHLVVDAIQAAGILPIDVAELGIDALASGGHKGLLGPYGVGFLYCRHDRIAEWEPAYAARSSIRPTDTSYSYADDFDCCLLPTAGRYEVGNYNYEGLAGQDAALRFLLSFDRQVVARHVLGLSARFAEGLREVGITPLNRTDEQGRSGIVSFRPADAASMRTELARRGTAVAVKGDAIRVSFHLFNNRDDVDGLLADIRHLAQARAPGAARVRVARAG